MMDGTLGHFFWGQVMLAVPLGMALGLQGAMVVEIFPLRSRVTSMSVAYSVTLALAGGTAPMVATWLIDTMKQPLAPAYYVFLYGADRPRDHVADERDEHPAPRPIDRDARWPSGAGRNSRIFSSSNTPSQRATTAVAMQLPMTFTDVRPMSRI